MYNLLIVEDEENIRKRIESHIDWENIGFKMVGSLSNGLEAFEFISENIVHVALVDIKMPKMDGLELMRQCNMLKITTKFVFLSAFDSFQYAQTAVNLGAKGYLLKPLKQNEAMVIFQKMIRELETGRKIKGQKAVVSKDETEVLSGIPVFVKKAMIYVSKNYEDKHTLESISKILYVSPAYFGIAFKKSTGISFVDYLSNIRVNKAKEILTSLSCSIKDVAMRVGYDDYTYFCKVFKKNTGCTPLEYRKQILFGR